MRWLEKHLLECEDAAVRKGKTIVPERQPTCESKSLSRREVPTGPAGVGDVVGEVQRIGAEEHTDIVGLAPGDRRRRGLCRPPGGIMVGACFNRLWIWMWKGRKNDEMSNVQKGHLFAGFSNQI